MIMEKIKNATVNKKFKNDNIELLKSYNISMNPHIDSRGNIFQKRKINADAINDGKVITNIIDLKYSGRFNKKIYKANGKFSEFEISNIKSKYEVVNTVKSANPRYSSHGILIFKNQFIYIMDIQDTLTKFYSLFQNTVQSNENARDIASNYDFENAFTNDRYFMKAFKDSYVYDKIEISADYNEIEQINTMIDTYIIKKSSTKSKKLLADIKNRIANILDDQEIAMYRALHLYLKNFRNLRVVQHDKHFPIYGKRYINNDITNPEYVLLNIDKIRNILNFDDDEDMNKKDKLIENNEEIVNKKEIVSKKTINGSIKKITKLSANNAIKSIVRRLITTIKSEVIYIKKYLQHDCLKPFKKFIVESPFNWEFRKYRFVKYIDNCNTICNKYFTYFTAIVSGMSECQYMAKNLLRAIPPHL